MITVQYKDFDDMVATSKYIASLVGENAAVAAALPVMSPVAAAQEEPEKPQKEETAPSVPDKKESSEQPEEKTEAPVESGKTYTLEEVRAKLAELNKAGKRAEVKNLLGSFGAVKLSDIPTDKYGELMEKAGEL